MNLSNWFDPNIISEKREAIAEIIKKKMLEEANRQELPLLPDISFRKDIDDLEIFGVMECLNGNFHEKNDNFQENEGNFDGNNENGNDNNNQEEFNNNNDFNAIDNNIHLGVQEDFSDNVLDRRNIQDDPVTSTTNGDEENVQLSLPKEAQLSALFESK